MVQNNPVVVVTGSTRGIGRGLAESFLDRDCRTMVTGRSPSAVDQAVGELGDRFGAELVGGCPVDVTEIDQLRTLWATAVDRFGQVDIWINNAGASAKRKPLWEQSADEISRVVDTNLTGSLLASKVALEGMVAQGHGALWNMEGFGSNNEAQIGMAAYGASKRAVKYLNKALQKDIAGTGVLANTLSPGIVATDLLVDDYDHTSEEWAKAKKIFNILGDNVETVTPWMAEKVLATDKTGQRVAWLTKRKAAGRFMTSSFNQRELFDV
jgi:NAD(P)-dependent dehydrogenase (short-subunit alcohol dehydrogenase family)